MIEIENLHKYYGKKAALNGLCLRIDRGSIIGLVGPNGSGKSTAIKILATLLRPSSGMVSICGHDIQADPVKVRKKIGYVPEKAAAWDELNAFENLYHWGRIRMMDASTLRGRIQSMLVTMGLAGEHRVVASFSKGMMQRLVIGMALLPLPEVLLLDEPMTGLDPDGRLLLRRLMKSHLDDGKTVLISTHELLEASKVCTRILFMKDGKVVGWGFPKEEDIEVKYRELMG